MEEIGVMFCTSSVALVGVDIELVAYPWLHDLRGGVPFVSDSRRVHRVIGFCRCLAASEAGFQPRGLYSCQSTYMCTARFLLCSHGPSVGVCQFSLSASSSKAILPPARLTPRKPVTMKEIFLSKSSNMRAKYASRTLRP